MQEIQAIKQEETFQEIEKIEDIEEYLDVVEEELLDKLENLNQQTTNDTVLGLKQTNHNK